MNLSRLAYLFRSGWEPRRIRRRFVWCRHRHTSRVYGSDPHAYVVCFDCGRRLSYSWAEMRANSEEVK